MNAHFIRLILLFVIGLSTHSLHAEVKITDATYSGKIGKTTVTLTISPVDASGGVYGRYFYNSQCLDIPFEGTKKGAVLKVYAGSFYKENDEKEYFELSVKGSSMKGNWTYKGKKLAVTLTRINYDSKTDPFANNTFLKEKMGLTDVYERIRISKAVITPLDSIQTLKTGITIQWHKEKHWNSYVFRVTKGLPEPTLKWVNSYLEYQQLMDFSGRGTCSFGEESDYECSIADLFINQDFLAYNDYTSYFCGGAHPDFDSYQHNLDLRNMKQLKTEDLVRFANEIPDESNFDEWSIYRSEVFCPSLMGMLAEEHPEEMQAVDMENEEGCDYNEADVWNFSSALITEDGLWFSAYFYRAARMCDDPEWSVISYERLSENLHPTYKKALLSIGK